MTAQDLRHYRPQHYRGSEALEAQGQDLLEGLGSAEFVRDQRVNHEGGVACAPERKDDIPGPVLDLPELLFGRRLGDDFPGFVPIVCEEEDGEGLEGDGVEVDDDEDGDVELRMVHLNGQLVGLHADLYGGDAGHAGVELGEEVALVAAGLGQFEHC